MGGGRGQCPTCCTASLTLLTITGRGCSRDRRRIHGRNRHTHTHRRPLVCLTHTPSSSGGRCHLLTSIIGQCLIDDSKDFNGQNREDRSRKHFSTSCLCTWTFCISRLTGPGRSRFAGKTLCTRHLLPQVRPYGKTTELKFQQI